MKSSVLAFSNLASAVICVFCLSNTSVEAFSANSFTANEASSPSLNKWYSGRCENPISLDHCAGGLNSGYCLGNFFRSQKVEKVTL